MYVTNKIILILILTITEWNAQDCGISKAAKDTSMLPSKIDQMKVSHETGSEANFGFGRALMPSYLGMCPPKAAFFSFRIQPETEMFNEGSGPPSSHLGQVPLWSEKPHFSQSNQPQFNVFLIVDLVICHIRPCSHLASFLTRKSWHERFFSKIKSWQRFGYR